MPSFRTIFSTSPVNLLSLLNGSRQRFEQELDRDLYAVGAESVNRIRRDFRTGGTTETRTAVRTGRLVNSYGHEVKRDGGKVTLEIGAIRASGGKVPLHARVHEGYDASGKRVSQFVIRPKNGLYLVFPIRAGGGMAKANITGWVRTKQVILKPRPSLPTIAKAAPEEIKKRALLTFRRVLVGRAAA